MKRYAELQAEILEDINFRRLTGIKHSTSIKMVEVLTEAKAKKKAKGGRPNKLSVEDMLLMALEYWREYRTFYHIGVSYGLSESNTYYAIRWIEDILIKSGLFSLPGKKVLLKSHNEYEVILIDATETPIERPKSGRKIIIQERKNDTL